MMHTPAMKLLLLLVAPLLLALLDSVAALPPAPRSLSIRHHHYKPVKVPRSDNSTTHCKNYPGDPDWPTIADWRDFNDTVEGALISTIPPAAPCHASSFGPLDQTRCNSIRSRFGNSSFHINDPGSVMAVWATGNSCPLNNATAPCTNDGYPSYVVNVTNVRQIQLAVNFARNNNLRLIVKNTGHDFLGKSTGGGALSVWLHHLKDFQYLPYVRNGNYTGKAVRVGAGLQGYDLFRLMESKNITLVTADGSTVGAYGGYMQGGGYSAISSLYGLAADQVLSMEVVTADGRFVIADRYTNRDLFWAMRGGGGGTFGILVAAQVKAFAAAPITTLTLAFNSGLSTSTISTDVFWKGVRAYFRDITRETRYKISGLFVLSSPAIPSSVFRAKEHELTNNTTSLDARSYSMTLRFLMVNVSSTDMASLLSPLLTELTTLGINISLGSQNLKTYPSFARYNLQRIEANGIGDRLGNVRYSSRLFPQTNFEPNTTLFDKTFDAIKAVVDSDYRIFGNAIAPTSQVANFQDNSVHPAWRRAVLQAAVIDPLADGVTGPALTEGHNRLDKLVQVWRDLTPGSGTYMNEADVQEKDWQKNFYGDYSRLSSVKRKWDPRDVFYVATGVGSERWEVKAPGGGPTQNGKLCRTGPDTSPYPPPPSPPTIPPFVIPPNPGGPPGGWIPPGWLGPFGPPFPIGTGFPTTFPPYPTTFPGFPGGGFPFGTGFTYPTGFPTYPPGGFPYPTGFPTYPGFPYPTGFSYPPGGFPYPTGFSYPGGFPYPTGFSYPGYPYPTGFSYPGGGFPYPTGFSYPGGSFTYPSGFPTFPGGGFSFPSGFPTFPPGGFGPSPTTTTFPGFPGSGGRPTTTSGNSMPFGFPGFTFPTPTQTSTRPPGPSLGPGSGGPGRGDDRDVDDRDKGNGRG